MTATMTRLLSGVFTSANIGKNFPQQQEYDRARQPGAWTDRKSTRLNSSHVSTSYAVFCLKKQNYRSAGDHFDASSLGGLDFFEVGNEVRQGRAPRTSLQQSFPAAFRNIGEDFVRPLFIGE